MHLDRKESPYLYEYLPSFLKYLKEFPNVALNNSENVLYWMKENYGGKANHPILTINHLVSLKPQTPDGAIIMASKQLHATHYFEAALGLTGVVADLEGSRPVTYLLHIHRSRIDILREIPGFLASILFKGARHLLQRKMTAVRQNLEMAYQKKH